MPAGFRLGDGWVAGGALHPDGYTAVYCDMLHMAKAVYVRAVYVRRNEDGYIVEGACRYHAIPAGALVPIEPTAAPDGQQGEWKASEPVPCTTPRLCGAEGCQRACEVQQPPTAPAKASEAGKSPLSERVRRMDRGIDNDEVPALANEIAALEAALASFQVDQVQQAGALVEEQRKVRALEVELAEAKGRLREMTRTASDAMDEATAARAEVEQWKERVGRAEAELRVARGESTDFLNGVVRECWAFLLGALYPGEPDVPVGEANTLWALCRKAAAEVERLRAKLVEAERDAREWEAAAIANEQAADERVLAAEDRGNAREAAMRAAAAKVAREYGYRDVAEAIERLPLSTEAQPTPGFPEKFAAFVTENVALAKANDKAPPAPAAEKTARELIQDELWKGGLSCITPRGEVYYWKAVELAVQRAREAQPDAIKAAVLAAREDERRKERKRCLAWLQQPISADAIAEGMDSGDPTPTTDGVKP